MQVWKSLGRSLACPQKKLGPPVRRSCIGGKAYKKSTHGDVSTVSLTSFFYIDRCVHRLTCERLLMSTSSSRQAGSEPERKCRRTYTFSTYIACNSVASLCFSSTSSKTILLHIIGKHGTYTKA